ncbi:hypothetical protein EDD42_3912 [Plantibacter flavus]|uniref:Uncharacterized protein n=1 Tax=Plantibacter flavus TaxID=150123 RepID=A0A3N2BL12_9MICO|nr:hypothetical protein EDD42_3912 [Plantibacter flavus]
MCQSLQSRPNPCNHHPNHSEAGENLSRSQHIEFSARQILSLRSKTQRELHLFAEVRDHKPAHYSSDEDHTENPEVELPPPRSRVLVLCVFRLL